MRLNNRLKKVAIVVLGICLLSSIIISFLVLKKFIDYRKWIPPVTTPDAGVCEKSGLVAYWKFDKIVGDSTPDANGKYNGQFQAYLNINHVSDFLYGFPKLVEGKKGKALQFNGKQWVSGGNRSCFNVEKFTVALWVWQDNDKYKVPTIIAKSSWAGYDGWWLCTTNDRFLDLGIAWGNGFVHVESGYRLPLKEWHYVAVSVNNIDHEVQFYVDGLPYGKKHTNVHKWLINWNHDLFIGGYDGSGNWPWHGRLDDVRFYSKILSPKEILAIYSDK